ncbi:hypothetical protein BDQ17DRAFT_1300250 [Cyathus striatus]|nr:hypothetical protein BDQ17DRAFT_1300250 [Cyathus striatus]
MPNPSLPRQIRLVLESAPDALPINELLVLIDQFVLECSSLPDSVAQVSRFEEELQSLHHELYFSHYQLEIFLAILYHLSPVLPYSSVISWFDPVLRPALREHKLPTGAINHAKELIISALQKTNEVYADKVKDFRRRLFELYLLDAYNEGSGDDILEWAELDEEQKEKRTRWKVNLEDILVKYGGQCPEELMTEVDFQFTIPSTRLQLITLLNLYISGPYFASGASVLATHPLMNSLMYSLLLDNSSTVCTAGLTLIVKALPFIAVHAHDRLRIMLPKLLAILARIMCWKERPPSNAPGVEPEEMDLDFERELENETRRVLHINPNFKWIRLEMTFDAMPSPPPSSRPYFTALYYLYPSNVLRFLRAPAQYLENNDLQSPYTESWQEALDEVEIRRRSENLLREHVCHPLLIWRDAVVELSEPEFWVRYNVSRIVSETVMLDVRNHALGLQARYESKPTSRSDSDSISTTSSSEDSSTSAQLKSLKTIDISSGKVVISLENMINTSIALKTNVNVEVQKPKSQWARELFFPPIFSNASVIHPIGGGQTETAHVALAISGLQREVLLLRNELNFELWLSRENAKHIGRLYQDRIVMKTAEAERQGLYNKLRKYRSQVNSLEAELKEHKAQASSAKDKYADWNIELQKKLKELREEKKNWITEAAALRIAEKEAKAHFAAQGKLLAEAAKQVFEFQTQWKENQHKIDRLKDYEGQIEQHIKIQRLWEMDFAKFNERAGDVVLLTTQCKQLQLRIDSLEHTLHELQEISSGYQNQMQALEAQLSLASKNTKSSGSVMAEQIASFVSEKGSWLQSNAKLKKENTELKEVVEELQVMVESLRSRRTGLGSEARSSPVPYP